MILGVIPARGGSKGIPRKNIKSIAGKPLIAWTILAAQESKLIDRLVISTEDPEIAAIAREYGAEVIERPAELATDEATTLAVLQDILTKIDADTIVLLQPTSPVRDPGLIDKCIRQFKKTGVDNLGTGFNCKFMSYGSYMKRRQELNGFFYDDGNVYVINSDLIRRGKLHGKKMGRIEISREQNIEIDDPFDFWLAEQVLLARCASQRSSAKYLIKVKNKKIGFVQPVFIIAEAGVNHNGSLKQAKIMVDKAKAAGADAIKFQTFRAQALVTKTAPKAGYQNRTVKTKSHYEMLKDLELSADDFRQLADYCKSKGIIFLSSPFDEESAELLRRLNVPAYKIGSGEITNLSLLAKVAGYGKPIILSTGMADLKEVSEAVEIIYAAGNRKLVLLHCTSNYPTMYEDVNLQAMLTLQKEFKLPIGYSDHTEGILASITAVALGATVIEKHVTLDKAATGPDHQVSLDFTELKNMIEEIRKVEMIMGTGEKAPRSSEFAVQKVVRKSVVATDNIPVGTKLVAGMLAIKRPGTGISPKYLPQLLNNMTVKPIVKDQVLSWKDVK